MTMSDARGPDARGPDARGSDARGSDARRLDGWLVVDKPSGITSNRVVERVRRATGVKTGHAGTLDPLATGVLPIALGEATKTAAYAMGGRKCYRFRVRWGVARDSDDSDGEIVGESPLRPQPGAIETMLPRFTGTVMQAPPAYSAVKLAGRRAYALARAGQSPVLAPRPVEIASLRLTALPDPDHAEFEALVGKGTYIRALARDLAAALGTFGHIAALRRLAVGCFTEAHAIPLESIEDRQHIAAACGHLLPIETALDGIPALVLSAEQTARLRCGQRVSPTGGRCQAHAAELAAGAVVSVWHDHALIALARVEDGRLRPLRVINW
jgi:tRNA pseudouridine55 synthase